MSKNASKCLYQAHVIVENTMSKKFVEVAMSKLLTSKRLNKMQQCDIIKKLKKTDVISKKSLLCEYNVSEGADRC